MTDAARYTEPSTEDGSELHTVIKRRLVGLAVLLAGLFLLSLLLRNAGQSPQALPSVVIPLGTGGGPEARVSTSGDPSREPVAELSAANNTAVSASLVPDQAATAAAVAAEPAPIFEATSPEPAAAEPAEPGRAPASQKPQAAAAKPAPAKPAVAKAEAAPRWFVAVGAYKDPMAAQAIANRVKLAGFKADVGVVTVNKEKLQRVRAGPFDSKAAAESARVTLIVEGLTKAVTILEK